MAPIFSYDLIHCVHELQDEAHEAQLPVRRGSAQGNPGAESVPREAAQSVAMITLRDHMRSLEGHEHADWAIGHGFQAWAVERTSPCLHRTDSAMVFAKSRSDALRKADSPARLGLGCHGDVTTATKVGTDWEAPPYAS